MMLPCQNITKMWHNITIVLQKTEMVTEVLTFVTEVLNFIIIIVWKRNIIGAFDIQFQAYK